MMIQSSKKIIISTRWILVAVVLTVATFSSCVIAQRTAPSLVNDKLHSDSSHGYFKQADDIIVQNGQVMNLGGIQELDLGFEGIRMELTDKKLKKKTGSDKRLVLDGSIRGRAQPGRMLAIMGPSGAGKSTVLHALAGRIKDSPKIELYGHRIVNGQQIAGDSFVPAAFVEQEANFFPYMTIRETLNFRVELKLGSVLSKQDRDEIVTDLIKQMRLTDSADTIVGDNKVRGISGGERRRLAIACELISSPSGIFLDEPTSGLDSTAATKVVETLRALADSGKTIIAVIHQPSQHVFAAFDDILLVSEGKQMYFGPVKNVRSYMDKNACKANAEIGTAEHVLDCITNAPLQHEESAADRIERLHQAAANQVIDIGKGKEENDDSNSRKKGQLQRFLGDSQRGPRANIFVQFKLLLKRSLGDNFRGKAALIIKAVQQVSLGVIYGGIYNLGTNQASIQDRFGLLSLIVIGSANMAMASTIRSFPKEKAIVSNELAAKMYGTLPYFIGKAISEFPLIVFFNSLFGVLVSNLTGLNNTRQKFRRFLGLNSLHGLASQSVGLVIGAISPSSDSALALFPAILVLNLIFDGKNISEENTPRLLRWIPKVGLVRWGFEGLCLNEFEGLTFDTTGDNIRGPVAKTGEDALSRFGLADKNLSQVVRAQTIITAVCWFMSYVGLTLTRQKYAVMQEPVKAK